MVLDPKKKKKEFENITTLDLGGNFKQAGNLNPIPSVTELLFFLTGCGRLGSLS